MNRLLDTLVLCTLLGIKSVDAQPDSVPLWKTMRALEQMPVPDKSGLASINGLQLYYAVFNNHGSSPVMLLHGGLGSSNWWAAEVKLLARNHKVIVMDSRGHGRSTLSDEPLTYALMTSDVLELMNYLRLKKCSIVGWSDGGIIGILLAIKAPDRINKLFTYGSNYSKSGEKDEPMDKDMTEKFMAQAEANYRESSPTPDSFPRLKKVLFSMYAHEPEISTDDIKKITAPTVIACGEYEQFYTREHFASLAALIPHAKLVVLPNLSHGGPVQDPIRFHNAVVSFLDSK
jgi:pimeloyl-ACP methyl ester carboxylesterase